MVNFLLNQLYRDNDIGCIDHFAQDGLAPLFHNTVDQWSDEQFETWFKYHLSVCSEKSIIDMSNHVIIIGKKIRKFRQKLGMTQHDLAEKVGVTEKQISKIETGIHYPKFENFVKILDSLKISLKEFSADMEQDKELSPQQKSLLKLFNKLSDVEIEYIVSVAKELEKLRKKSIK